MKVIKIDKSEQKPIKCSQCDVRFASKKNIERHMQLKHYGKILVPVQCFHCKKVYQTKGNHDAHFEKKHLAEHLLYVQPEKFIAGGT